MLTAKILCFPLFLYLCSVSALSAAQVGLAFYLQEKKKEKTELEKRKEKGRGKNERKVK